MSEKNKRNALCHCGSGKKYKKCCLIQALPTKATTVVDFEWRRLRQLEGQVVEQIFADMLKNLSGEMIGDAMNDFYPDEYPEDWPDELDGEIIDTHFFTPWLLFNWIPADNFGLKGFDENSTIAMNFLKKHEKQLDSQIRAFISAMDSAYYSFYRILHSELNTSLEIKDILLDTTHVVKEQKATHQLKRGDIILSRILTLNDQSILVGTAPLQVPIKFYDSIIDFKEWMQQRGKNRAATPQTLVRDYECEIIDHFFDILKAAYNQSMPTLVNSNGEPMQFSKSYFQLTLPPEETLDKLLTLSLSENKEEFLKDAKRDAAGILISIEFPWLDQQIRSEFGEGHTILGHITIKKDRLILETNSSSRTETGKELLNSLLGDKIQFQQTLLQTPEQMFTAMKDNPAKGNLSDQNEKDQLMETPEMQAHLNAMAKTHWKKWFDEPIPMLNDQAPRQAAKTVKGRERLEDLLLYYERMDEDRGNNPFKADIGHLRAELKLDKPLQDDDNMNT